MVYASQYTLFTTQVLKLLLLDYQVFTYAFHSKEPSLLLIMN